MRERKLREHPLLSRRVLLGAGLAIAPALAGAEDEPDPASAPPQQGDHLIFLTGPRKGMPIHVNDLKIGDAQVQAYPAAPDGTVRNGSRLNLVIVARVPTDGMGAETKTRSADGVVAYSGVCTHQNCPVNMWSADRHAFVCSCHGSVYDPKNAATVEAGPAPRRLPALPLKSDNGMVIVAAGFTGRIGMQPG